MALYRVKRIARDLVARRSPRLYAKHVEWIESSVPLLNFRPGNCDLSSLDMARSVSEFYIGEYIDSIDDVADGKVALLNRQVEFGRVEDINWHHELDEETDFHLWRQKLAHMGFLCPMLVVGTDKHLSAVRRLIASHRIKARFDVPGCFSSYWFPYSVSHRILAVLSGYALASHERELAEPFHDEIESFLRWNVAFLLGNIEHDLRNNHVERNLAALCMYFSFVGRPDRSICTRLDREVRRVMKACILADGLTAERSAMYQGLAVMSLGVFSKAACLSPETREVAQKLHSEAVRAWHMMTHPDGDIALFNDSWIGEIPRARDISGDRDFAPLELLSKAGYARLQSDAVFVLMDSGPIGPRWCPGHGHADFLAVEIDVWNKRFIVDPGTFQYSTGPRRAFERSASSHNGPNWKLIEPVEYTGCFRVGKMSEAELVESDPFEDGGSVRGQLKLKDGSSVDRTLTVSSNLVHVVDNWFGRASGAAVRLIVSDAWVIDDCDNKSVLLMDGGANVRLTVLEGHVATVAAGEWSSHYLETRAGSEIVLEPLGDAERTRLTWEVEVLS